MKRKMYQEVKSCMGIEKLPTACKETSYRGSTSYKERDVDLLCGIASSA